MTSAVVLTILGILVILSDKGLEPFKSVNLNPHPIFGLFVFLGAVDQMLIEMHISTPLYYSHDGKMTIMTTKPQLS